MADTPKPDTVALRGIPAPPPADYSDEISDAQWEAICAATEEFQQTEGSEIISGEPW